MIIIFLPTKKIISIKRKIHFIHFNHTNGVLQDESAAANSVIENGFLLSNY